LEIRPLLLIHGGGIDLLAIDEDGRVELEFQGACRGCALQSVTYAIGVRQRLMEIPGVREVDVRGVRLSKMALQRTAEMYRGYTFRPGGTVRST
ncbi:MAG: NifU family protein, partial [Pseudorhodoplanes sp.]